VENAQLVISSSLPQTVITIAKFSVIKIDEELILHGLEFLFVIGSIGEVGMVQINLKWDGSHFFSSHILMQ